MMKRISAALTVFILILQFNVLSVFSEEDKVTSSQIPVFKSEAVLLMDQKTGRVLFEKDSHKKMYPASLTKILTAILIMENLNLDEKITVGKEINLVGKDSSGAGLKVGESITGKDLVWALMLPSGNDASYTAAVSVAVKKNGKAFTNITDAVKYFTELMNKRAKEIGVKESSFTNPDGYPDENHYSTAHDLALIAREAMKNDFFREVVSTYSFKGPPEWLNINQMINPDSKYYYKYANGIKTGNTSAAGYCLAASAVKDDIALISIVLKADSNDTRWVESKALFEYGFGNFKYNALMKKGESIGQIKVVRKYLGDVVEINALADQEYSGLFTDQDLKNIKRTIKWDPALVLTTEDKNQEVRLSGPIKKGQEIGKVSYTLNENILVESRLLANKDSMKGDITDTIYNLLEQGFTYRYIIIPVFILIIAFIMLIILRQVFKRKK